MNTVDVAGLHSLKITDRCGQKRRGRSGVLVIGSEIVSIRITASKGFEQKERRKLNAGQIGGAEETALWSHCLYAKYLFMNEIGNAIAKRNILLLSFRFFWVVATSEMSHSVHRRLDSCRTSKA